MTATELLFHPSARLVRGVFVLGFWVLPAIVFAAPKGDLAAVIVNVDLTEEGRKIPPPTPGRPAYYVPVILGYHESGKIVAGEEPPKREELIRQLGGALAKEGYVLQALRPDANRTLPALILAIEWGYLNPLVIEHGGLDLSTGEGGTMAPPGIRDNPAQDTSTDFNQAEMITLVAGSAIKRQAAFTSGDWEKLRDAVAEGRYYIIVSAFDFQASLKGEQKLLWRARMSTERQGVWMNDVVPTLVTAGAPLFGRQTDLPRWTYYPVREGRVILHEPVYPDFDKAPAK